MEGGAITFCRSLTLHFGDQLKMFKFPYPFVPGEEDKDIPLVQD